MQDGFDRKLHPISSKTSQKKNKNHKNNEPSKQMKKKADLKTRKEKYQTKQNSCAANNTVFFIFMQKVSFSKIK